MAEPGKTGMPGFSGNFVLDGWVNWVMCVKVLLLGKVILLSSRRELARLSFMVGQERTQDGAGTTRGRGSATKAGHIASPRRVT